MKRFGRFPVWYSVVACVVMAIVMICILVDPVLRHHDLYAPAWINNLVFFFFFLSFINCLPLTIVAIFLLLKKETRRYGLINFALVICFLYVCVRIAG